LTQDVGPTPGPRQGRRAAARRARRRRQRRLLAALLVVALVVLAGATYVLSSRDKKVQPAVPRQQRTQSTLLVQVQGEGGDAVGMALLAHDPASRTGAAVLIPPQLLVAVPGAGTMPLGRALQTLPPERSRAAVADLLGVTVDAGWVINLPTLARLVDQVGGVQLDVNTAVPSGKTVLIQPGQQRLDGARAVVYLRYLAPGEQEQSRLARLKQVLDGLLAALPRSTAQVVSILSGLGARSDVSTSPAQLATLLVGLADDQRSQQLQYASLPVVPAQPGSSTLRPDAQAIRQLVDRLLAQSVPPGVRRTGNRVLALNGVGTPGLGEQVRARLVAAGFVFVGARNNATFGVAQTRVLVKDATPAIQAVGLRAATALGLSGTSVQTADLGSVADLVVVIGADVRPAPTAG
jgi:anionic cell wall polymer biosynthesis LytR-Cps2A-Psr (LCP) family protein